MGVYIERDFVRRTDTSKTKLPVQVYQLQPLRWADRKRIYAPRCVQNQRRTLVVGRPRRVQRNGFGSFEQIGASIVRALVYALLTCGNRSAHERTFRRKHPLKAIDYDNQGDPIEIQPKLFCG